MIIRIILQLFESSLLAFQLTDGQKERFITAECLKTSGTLTFYELSSDVMKFVYKPIDASFTPHYVFFMKSICIMSQIALHSTIFIMFFIEKLNRGR